jgi:hypothetical protein
MPTEALPSKSAAAANGVVCNWTGTALKNESTLHQLSPYIGKLKSSIAASLISQFTNAGDLIYDPFSGSGTVALEAWGGGRRIVANDLSPYACVLTRAKLFPPRTLEEALSRIDEVSSEALKVADDIDLREVPIWVPPIPFEQLPYASLLIFVDAIQDDRRDIAINTWPRHGVLNGLEVLQQGTLVRATVCLREIPLRYWPSKLLEYDSARRWLNSSAVITFEFAHSPRLEF